MNKNKEEKYEEVETKLRQKKRKNVYMHKSGKSVFELQKLIKKPKKK